MSTTLDIILTSQKGTTLNTEGVYCDKNIAIVPRLEDIVVAPKTEEQTTIVSDGYVGIKSVTVEAVQTEEKTTAENGEVIPSYGKFLSKVVVDIPTYDGSCTGGVEFEGDAPYYDGIVIIEKAESVLGLRRFIVPPTTDGVELLPDVSSLEEYEADENNYAPCVLNVYIEGELVWEIKYLSVQYFVNLSNNVQFAVIGYDENRELIGSLYYSSEGEVLSDLFTMEEATYDFEVSGNSNLDTWLLANTEGVNV